MLADLESLERRALHLVKRARGGDKEAKVQLAVVEPVLVALREGTPARDVTIGAEQQRTLTALQLLSAKPVLYIANVDEAIEAGSRCPGAMYGTIELRPIQEFPDQPQG